METLKINRELVTIWALAIVSILTVIFTHNRIFMLPLFAYLVYKSIRGIITNRSNYYFIPYSFVLAMSFYAIYAIVLRSLAQ